jgi:anti-anti-sigma regulatory factor
MQLQCFNQDENVILKVKGHIDSFSYHLFAKEISLISRIEARKVIIDLSECHFINYNAIKLLSKYEKINQTKGREYQYLSTNKDFIELFYLLTGHQVASQNE